MHQLHTMAVRQPVVDNGENAGVAKQHFIDTARGGVAPVGGHGESR